MHQLLEIYFWHQWATKKFWHMQFTYSLDMQVLAVSNNLFCLSITWSRCHSACLDLWIMTIHFPPWEYEAQMHMRYMKMHNFHIVGGTP